jgi:hypothetical protein
VWPFETGLRRLSGRRDRNWLITSNFMYKGFVYAEDAITDFVRGLDSADSVAVYTFSRNLSRASGLTREKSEAIAGLRKAVAGDDTALYNALLLTLRDAAKVPRRKVVIVFSNGPDNASMVAPDDVRAVAEDEGTTTQGRNYASNIARDTGRRRCCSAGPRPQPHLAGTVADPNPRAPRSKTITRTC